MNNEYPPELLNSGEIADSLMWENSGSPFSKFVASIFDVQTKHKVLFLSKSDEVDNIIRLGSDRIIPSFTLNSYLVASKWEHGAPSVKKRIEAAEKLFNVGYPVRIRIDPLVPIDAWEEEYLTLLDDVFSKDGVSSKNPTAIAILMFWINTIRASVINNASAPTYGPPIIKLRHGIMYQNIPCICKNYSIETVEEAGYDLATLLPRRLKISLNLEEIKYSNLPFKPNFSTGGEGNPDGVAGWESLENFGTLDPGI